MTRSPHYGLDIETDTTVDGLDPSCSRVVAVAVTTPAGDRVLMGDEADLLRGLEELLGTLAPGVLVTWNGAAFDLPFLATRAAVHRIALGLRLFPGPELRHDDPVCSRSFLATWGAHGHLDGYRLYRADVGRTLGLSCGLKAMARLAGLRPVQVDRSQIHTLSPEELSAYVASDARLACELVARRLPAAAAFVDRCPTGRPSPDRTAVTVTAS
jgi:hypothetical protein